MKINLTLRNVYGPKAYPNCKISDLICMLTRTKSLDSNHISILKKMGFEILYDGDENLKCRLDK